MDFHFFDPIIGVLIALVHQYGLLGLFISALVGSTVFIPFSVEAAIAVMLSLRENPYIVVLVASIGALMGTWVNYAIGCYASELAEKKIGEENIRKAKKAMDKYGWPGLFLIIMLPTPIPVDPVTIIPGMMRMNVIKFSLTVFFAKLIRYALFVGLLQGIFGIIHLPLA
jgi:membrane protein YqaA with SNARE-associated domain